MYSNCIYDTAFITFSLIGCVIFSGFKISFNSSSFNRPSSNTSSFTEIPVFSDFFAISADFAYPIYGHNAVEIPTLFSIYSSHCPLFAVIPVMQCFVSVAAASFKVSMDSNK